MQQTTCGRRRIYGALGAVLLCAAVAPAPADVLITEFMASNDSTILDGNGASSDWVELHNTGSNAVDLAGWYLSDDPAELAKWAFPSTNVAAGGYLVVFASGTDAEAYVDPGGYLHTTFRLSRNDGDQGECVALVRSDGVTVDHAFWDYPEQAEDVSYGLPFDLDATDILAAREDARARIPAGPISGWTEVGYDDSGWLNGRTGVGYERQTGYQSVIRLDVGAMWNSNPSVYVRVPFEVGDPSAYDLLILRMLYDDGFVAYLNGQELTRMNAPTSVIWRSAAPLSHEAVLGDFEDFDVSATIAALATGTNVLAIQGMNERVNSSDLLVLPELTGIEIGAPRTNQAAFFTSPTPGAVNVTGVDGFVGDTTFTVDRGFYTNAFSVAIATDTPDAQIYYTLDGQDPTPATGTLYTNAITVGGTTVLRARATKAGYVPSDVDTQTYVFIDDVMTQSLNGEPPGPDWPAAPINRQRFDYGLDTNVTEDARYADLIDDALLAIPSISLVTDLDNLFHPDIGIYVNAAMEGADWERETSAELIHPDGTDGFQINAGLRIRGNMSTSPDNPKHSLRLFFRTEYGDNTLEYALFGDEGVDTFRKIDLRTAQNTSWNLSSRGDECTFVREVFSRDLQGEMDEPYTRSRYYHLYINGQYWGLYQTQERADSHYGESYLGGDDDDYDVMKLQRGAGVVATDGNGDAYRELWQASTNGFDDDADYYAVQGLDADGVRDPARRVLLDVDNLVDYMIAVYYAGDRDGPISAVGQNRIANNYYALFNRAGEDGFQFFRHDAENTLLDVNEDRTGPWEHPNLSQETYFNPQTLHQQLCANTNYVRRFGDRVHRRAFNGGLLVEDACQARFAARVEQIDLAIIAESARWGDARVEPPRTKDDDWIPELSAVTNDYLPYRTEIFLDQLRAQGWYPAVDAPVFSRHGGSFGEGFTLTMTGTNEVYYTVDGSDPIDAGELYVGAVALTRTVQVKARALAGGTWSALAEAVFVPESPVSPLRVTEVMYHPGTPSGTETNYLESDFEFVEIQNTGNVTTGLAGVEFTEGVSFDFTGCGVENLPPGEFMILVSNLSAFTNRYPQWRSMHIGGEYRGRFFLPGALANEGEEITLVDGLGRTIQRFGYDDGWHPVTDGEGFSLTVLDAGAETNAWDVADGWRASAYVGGTPGEGAVAFWAPGDIVINEVLTHQDQDDPGDWIELFNASGETIALDGWYLSDDEDNPTRVALSNAPAVAPGGYVVLTEAAHFGANAVGTNGFALSESGDGVYLSSGTNGVLTGYRDSREFAAAARDVTYGLHVCRDGTTDFAPLSAQTSAGANAAPLIGPVVISEIHYHPADTNAFEFVELHNTAVTNVPLYDGDYPTNTWRLEGAIELIVPTGLVMTAGEYLLVAPTNAAAFTNTYAVPAGTRILGPYGGKLDNAGETLYLNRPGAPDAATGEIPWIPVEWVAYDDETPWPVSPDGGAASLERVDLLAYANDSVSWVASWGAPTPGAASACSDLDGDGMPDAWEIAHFGGTNAVNGGADDDFDGDGASNGDEWTAGTTPTNADSVFAIRGAEPAGSDWMLKWSSASSRYYRIWRGTDLAQPLSDAVAGPLPATPPENVHTVGQDTTPAAFYRVGVER